MEIGEPQIYAMDFEIFGKVQGVFFRKYTEKQANKLKLHGWCMNTDDGSVKGQVEGPKVNIQEMKQWLERTGSPKSRIDRSIFSVIKPIEKHTFKYFTIRR